MTAKESNAFEDDLLVSLPSGVVRGVRQEGLLAFRGIPFAEPPVGSLRFAAPRRMASWDGVLDARRFGPTPQRGGDGGTTLIPEPSIEGASTLNVNILTPSIESASHLPVLFWIHGGGFISGSPASPWYAGDHFARANVVTVTVSYRLGFDGFGWLPDAPNNRAVLDWLMALEWVRDNIVRFGGDAGRITIAGQSAGGGATLTLLGMESAQHLFHRAWSLSGAIADIPVERARRTTRELARSLGIDATAAAFSAVPEETLLNHQSDTAASARSAIGDTALAMAVDGFDYGPVVDGEIVLRPTPDSLRLGVGQDKPLVLGANDDEFTPFIRGGKLATRTAAEALDGLGVARTEATAYLHANADVVREGTARLLGRFATDRLFRTLIPRIATIRADSPADTWIYRFAWRSPVFNAAVHCLDVPFFFDCLDQEAVEGVAGPTPPQEIADSLHTSAVAFVARTDPGWAPWRRNADTTRVFDNLENGHQDVPAGFKSVHPLIPELRAI